VGDGAGFCTAGAVVDQDNDEAGTGAGKAGKAAGGVSSVNESGASNDKLSGGGSSCTDCAIAKIANDGPGSCDTWDHSRPLFTNSTSSGDR
jgi:hypothetical protein